MFHVSYRSSVVKILYIYILIYYTLFPGLKIKRSNPEKEINVGFTRTPPHFVLIYANQTNFNYLFKIYVHANFCRHRD